MGKRLISQNRGKGTPTYRSPRKGLSDIKYNQLLYSQEPRELIDLKRDPGRTSVIAVWLTDSGRKIYTIAHLGSNTGYKLSNFQKDKLGVISQLKDISAFTPIFNIQIKPKDGGKLVRSSGCTAHIIQHKVNTVRIKIRERIIQVSNKCYATVGIPAGGDHKTKPILKAGKAYHIAKSKARKYPYTSRIKMHHSDHPFGGSGKRRVGRPRHSSRNSSPGSKVGSIAPKRQGYKK
jgi:large subunit ribosomal protein L2